MAVTLADGSRRQFDRLSFINSFKDATDSESQNLVAINLKPNFRPRGRFECSVYFKARQKRSDVLHGRAGLPNLLAILQQSQSCCRTLSARVSFPCVMVTMKSNSVVRFAFLISLFTPATVRAENPFRAEVIPFVNEYCIECHNQETSEGELNLTQYTSVEMLGEHFRQWEHVISFMKKEEMPPPDSKQPSAELRAAMLKTLEQLLVEEARKLAGDPGVVLPRRLTNSEYNYTIRDLTGVDIQPAKSFPLDPASGEGFNNTGEALIMSPSLFKKYYAAAEHVADHVLLTPSGMRFAPYPVVTYADQKKFYENAIINFYERYDVDYDKYLTVAWLLRAQNSGPSATSSDQLADEHSLSRKYLQRLWTYLESGSEYDAFPGQFQQKWNALAEHTYLAQADPGIRSLARQIRNLARELCAVETPAIVSNAGNPPIYHIDRRNRTAADRDTFNEGLISDTRQLSVEIRELNQKESISLFIQIGHPGGDSDGVVVLSDLNFSTKAAKQYRVGDTEHNTPLQELLKKHDSDQLSRLNFGTHPAGTEFASSSVALAASTLVEITLPAKAFGEEKQIYFHAKATLDREHSKQGFAAVAMFNHQPSDEELTSSQFPLVNPEHPVAEKLRTSSAAFCSTFPNRFLYVDETRGLSAGFHLIEGFFRDDQPLCKLVLNNEQNQELDRLWVELRFGTDIAEKLLRGFVFFERSERNFMKHADFDSIKEEDPKLVEDETLSRFRDIYLARSNVKATGEDLTSHPIYVFFETIRTGLKQKKTTLKHAEPVFRQQL